jgi:tetratricopeptide (TPR) repeat protein
MRADPYPLFRQAVALHQQGRLAEAEEEYLRALALKPDFFEALYNRGLLLGATGREQDALSSLDKALVIHPDDAAVWNNRGNLLRRLKRYQDALVSFDRALTLKPDFADALYNRGNVLFLGLKRSEEAVSDFDKALALSPDFAQAWDNRGSALASLERPVEALASYDKALAIRPDYAEVWNNRGNVLQNLNRCEEALASFDRALALKPDFPNALCNRGNILFSHLKRAADAVLTYDKALALRPDFSSAWNNRGSALCGLGRLPESLASFERALALRSDYAEAWNNSGRVLFEMDRIEDGIAAFARGAEIAYGSDPQAHDRPDLDDRLDHKHRHDREQREWAENEARPAQKSGDRLAGAAIAAANHAAIAQWQTKKPQIAVIDNFLTSEALEGLRRFCLEAPVWRKPYQRGYIGAFPEHGFACPLLGQIAQELRDAYPAIFSGHPLRYLWGFKYDSQLDGIDIHADEAAVNVNFWLTPDDANLEPERGGLMIWDRAAPLDWDFNKYNRDTGAIRHFLASSGAKAVTVPYRANRAVIFDSDLFHETDTIRFKDGYANRRINVTMLFGRREQT